MNLIYNNILINIAEFSTILTFSLLLHLFIFVFLISEYLGNPLREFSYFILYKKQNLLIKFIFVISLFLIFYLNKNIFYLEDKVSITTTIENVKFEISGDLIKSSFNGAGAAGAFVIGAKIASSLLVKPKIGFLPKTGMIGGTAYGFTAIKLLDQTLSSSSSSVGTVIIETAKIEIAVKNNNLTNKSVYGYFVDSFGNFKKISKNSTDNTPTNLTKELNNNNYTASPEDTAKFLKELDEQNSNWRESFFGSDNFINSPLESNNSLIQFVLDALNNHLIINFITVYLLLMLLIIIFCKFILNNDIKFNRLEKYPLGTYINKFLIKYISIWQKIGNTWIFSIIISLIFFNSIVTFSTYHLILLLNN